jgi:two-component system cell cycle response regulator
LLNELAHPSDRRRFDAQLAARLLQAEGQQRRFAVLVVGADSLEWINRRWGRAAGDSVLRKLGRRLLASLVPDDLLARYDGNRFGVGRWAPSADQAVAFAQHLLGRVAHTPFDIPDSHDAAFLTASIGVALGEPGARPPDLVTAAEQALRRAKDAGGNRVSL